MVIPMLQGAKQENSGMIQFNSRMIGVGLQVSKAVEVREQTNKKLKTVKKGFLLV